MHKDICTLRQADHATPLVNAAPFDKVAAMRNGNAAVEYPRAADPLFVLTASLSTVPLGPDDNTISFSTSPTPRRQPRAP